MSAETPSPSAIRVNLAAKAAEFGISNSDFRFWGFDLLGDTDKVHTPYYYAEILAYLEAASRPSGGILVTSIDENVGFGNIQFIKIKPAGTPRLDGYLLYGQPGVEWKLTAVAHAGRPVVPNTYTNMRPEWGMTTYPGDKSKFISIGLLLDGRVFSAATYEIVRRGAMALYDVAIFCRSNVDSPSAVHILTQKGLGFVNNGNTIQNGYFRVGDVQEVHMPFESRFMLDTKPFSTNVKFLRANLGKSGKDPHFTQVSVEFSDILGTIQSRTVTLRTQIPRPYDFYAKNTLPDTTYSVVLDDPALSASLEKWVATRALISPSFYQNTYTLSATF